MLSPRGYQAGSRVWLDDTLAVALNIHAVFSCIRMRSETNDAVNLSSSSAACAIFNT
jgi:hypothetical protein